MPDVPLSAMPQDRERVVVFTGAGVSAESGLRTFRGSDGLWEDHRIEDVATPAAWERDPELVLRFYDARRAQVLDAQPNAAHRAIAAFERGFDVQVITQNIDDLHERGGSTKVLHLHGEILLARSTRDPRLVTRINGPSLRLGDRCALGSQLRPHIVWFGEPVPLFEVAAKAMGRADRVVIVGTSLQVHPAAGLIQFAPAHAPVHVVDPAGTRLRSPRLEVINEMASVGLPALADRLLRERV